MRFAKLAAMSHPTVPAALQVACLCADWCGTCREYAQAYAALQASRPDVSFHWLDVEDEADLLGDLDVENFPTLLIGVNGQPVFFGVLLPHIQTLERLVQDAAGLRPLAEGSETVVLRGLLQALRQRGH
jgi:thioredoxin 1